MKRFATIFGILLLLAGIVGFIPALCPNGLLFGVLAVNTMHNLVHIATGLVALIVAAMGEGPTRMYFRAFGIVYLLVVVLGLFAKGGNVLGMANNMPDVIFHFAVAAFALYCGFAGRRTILPPRGPDLRGA